MGPLEGSYTVPAKTCRRLYTIHREFRSLEPASYTYTFWILLRQLFSLRHNPVHKPEMPLVKTKWILYSYSLYAPTYCSHRGLHNHERKCEMIQAKTVVWCQCCELGLWYVKKWRKITLNNTALFVPSGSHYFSSTCGQDGLVLWLFLPKAVIGPTTSTIKWKYQNKPLPTVYLQYDLVPMRIWLSQVISRYNLKSDIRTRAP